MRCWEFMGCKEAARKVCPAYPDHGGDCWTLSNNTIAGGGQLDLETVEAKRAYCAEFCAFFKKEHAPAHRS